MLSGNNAVRSMEDLSDQEVLEVRRILQQNSTMREVHGGLGLALMSTK